VKRISKRYVLILAALAASACTLVGSAGARPLAGAPPTILGFSPTHGPVGEKVTIYGHDLTGATVMFGTVQATNATLDVTGTHLTVYVPADATGSNPLVVNAVGGSVTTKASFSVTAQLNGQKTPRPHIWAFAPTRGKVGTRVTIQGSNLGGAIWVKFAGVKAAYLVPSSTRIVARVPAGAHTGRIMIKTSTGLATRALRFVVVGSGGYGY
jgi:hypothetical protein